MQETRYQDKIRDVDRRMKGFMGPAAATPLTNRNVFCNLTS
jgi:hypothetical protein